MSDLTSALHVFFDDVEWYVASSVEDAKALQRDWSGCDARDQEAADWCQLPDDGDIRMWLDPDTTELSVPCLGAILVIGTCEVWAEVFGRGFLGSTEY